MSSTSSPVGYTSRTDHTPSLSHHLPRCHPHQPPSSLAGVIVTASSPGFLSPVSLRQSPYCDQNEAPGGLGRSSHPLLKTLQSVPISFGLRVRLLSRLRSLCGLVPAMSPPNFSHSPPAHCTPAAPASFLFLEHAKLIPTSGLRRVPLGLSI